MPTSDVVADLYDTFLRRAGDPDVCEQVARDLRMRHEERQPHRIAARRVRRGGVLRVLVFPLTWREAVFAVAVWTVIGAATLALAIGLSGVVWAACSSMFVVFALVVASVLWAMGIGIPEPTRPFVCQQCGYDLAGLPAAINPAFTDGESTGPARCPECGMRWPLVPRSRPE